MEQFIGCDVHKKFSLFIAMNEQGEYGQPMRVNHDDRNKFRSFLTALPRGSQIALETSGSYYWIVDEFERIGHRAHLAHALTAKRRMEGRHKTDERDARGLAMLLRNGTLPEVWIPPRELRDQREMCRWRMCLVEGRAQIKNRIHGVLMRYNVSLAAEDIYGADGRQELASRLAELPEWTQQSVLKQLETVDYLQLQIEDCEQLLETMLKSNVERDLLQTLLGVGKILSAVIALEIGTIGRFPSAEDFASYAGLVPAARESAAKKRKGKCPADCNCYLKWAFVEAANVISLHRRKWPERHVVQLYERVKHRTQMHGKATVAVARHLAEAAYWMLTKQEGYREPKSNGELVRRRTGKRDRAMALRG
jgi:transposase